MKTRPILFSASMIRALLDGRKSQTRRVVKDVPCDDRATFGYTSFTPLGHISCRGYGDAGYGEWFVRCPYGQPGDRLVVKETWAPAFAREARGALFAADGAYVQGKRRHEKGPHYNALDLPPVKWRPSLFLPLWASRITLEIESVRVERLQDISEEDAAAEGVEPVKRYTHYGDGATDGGRLYWREPFAALWDSINAKTAPWASNPWVWAITFKRVETSNG